MASQLSRCSRSRRKRVAEQVRRGLVASEEQPEQDRRHLLLAERVPGGVRSVHQVGGEVPLRRRPSIVGQRLAVAPEARHTGCDVDLLVLAGPAEHEQQTVGRALLHRIHVGRRYAEDVEHHERRQLPGERRHDLGPSLVKSLGDEAADQLADEVLHLRHPPRREGEVGNAPSPGVGGRIDVREGRNGAKATVGQCPTRRGARREQWRERVRGREGLVLSQYPPYVDVARHHPVAQLRRPEHRLVLDEATELGVGILEERIGHRVERRGRHRGPPLNRCSRIRPAPSCIE